MWQNNQDMFSEGFPVSSLQGQAHIWALLLMMDYLHRKTQALRCLQTQLLFASSSLFIFCLLSFNGYLKTGQLRVPSAHSVQALSPYLQTCSFTGETTSSESWYRGGLWGRTVYPQGPPSHRHCCYYIIIVVPLFGLGGPVAIFSSVATWNHNSRGAWCTSLLPIHPVRNVQVALLLILLVLQAPSCLSVNRTKSENAASLWYPQTEMRAKAQQPRHIVLIIQAYNPCLKVSNASKPGASVNE